MEAFVNLRDKSVKYSSNKGEELPFNDKMFDLLIVDNVLDHCENPLQVLSEIKRVLKEDGLVYFRQNTYNYYGKAIRAIMEFFLIDRGHPFTFTKSGLRKFFQQYDFEILKSKSNGYFDTWKGEITSGNAKNMLKALLFVTRDRLTVLLKNR